jgi:hypothetical protein
MATQSRIISILFDSAGNTASVSFNYDDITFLILSVTIINNLSFAVKISATNTLPPFQNFSNSIPVGINQTIDVSVITWGLDPLTLALLDGWTFGF